MNPPGAGILKVYHKPLRVGKWLLNKKKKKLFERSPGRLVRIQRRNTLARDAKKEKKREREKCKILKACKPSSVVYCFIFSPLAEKYRLAEFKRAAFDNGEIRHAAVIRFTI